MRRSRRLSFLGFPLVPTLRADNYTHLRREREAGLSITTFDGVRS
jgi:hypothetical protein